MQTRRDPDTGGEIHDQLSFNAADARALREDALQKGTAEARQHLTEILKAVKRAASEEAASYVSYEATRISYRQHTVLLAMLKERFPNTTYTIDQRDGTYFTIRW